MVNARALVYSVIFAGVGVFLIWTGFQAFKMKRLIENIPTSKIRSVAMGLVEIAGHVVSDKKLKSPFSNKDCVYYKYIIQEYRSSGKHSRWVTIKKGNDCVPFYLKDSTGKVLVDPKGANIDIPKDFEFKSGFRKDPPIVVKQFLTANRLKFESFLGMNKTMRYREYFIAPNDKLYIMGTAGDNPYVEEATARQSTEDIMIQKGRHEKVYYISDKPEHAVLKSIKLKAFGGLIFGPILILIGIGAILINLGLF